MKPASEQALARPVVEWLRSQHWTVYQEVGTGGAVADIVVTQGKLLGVVEVKTTFGLALLEQLHGWRGRANFIWGAAPYSRRSGFTCYLCSELGFGVLAVGHRVDETVAPLLRRRRDDTLERRLRPEHISGYAEAGSIGGGGRWTPFAETCRNVAEYVRANPGASMRDVVESIQTHYSTKATARSCLAKWIEGEKVPGVELRRVGKRMEIWPAKKAQAAP